MHSDISLGRSQALLKQRNMLVVAALALLCVVLLLTMALLTRDREVVLLPVLGNPTTITSAGLKADYLEGVTRDTALVLLNRSPDNLEYWQEQVLRVTAESQRGEVRRELLKIRNEMRNSELTQAFVMTGMRVNPPELWSEVDGIISTYAGQKVISRNQRTYRFKWRYNGISLSMEGFEIVSDKKTGER